MNTLTLIGIIVVAVGTLLTAYGSSLSDSRAASEAQAALDEGLESFRRELRNAQGLPEGESDQELDKLEEKFSAWASEFGANKDQIRLKFESNALEVRVREESKFADARALFAPSLDFTLATMKAIFGAYEASSKSGFEFAFPNVPDDYINVEHDKAIAVLNFGDKVEWNVRFEFKELFGDYEVGIFRLVTSDGEAHPKVEILALIKLDASDEKFTIISSVPSLISAVEGQYSISDFEEVIPAVFRELLEFELSGE